MGESMRIAFRVLGFLVPLTLLGQSDPVYKQLVTGGTAASITTPNAPSIGQNTHQFTVNLVNAPSKTCNVSAAFGFNIQVSWDNSNFFSVVSNTVNRAPIGTFGGTTMATGTYPYVRGVLANWDNTNCIANIFYSGSKSFFTPQRPLLAVTSVNGAGANGNLGLEVFNLASGSCCTQEGPGPGGGIFWGIYSMVVSNLTSGQTLSIYSGPSSCSGGVGCTLLYQFNDLQAGQVVVLPWTGDPYATAATAGDGIFVGESAATRVDVSFQWRFE